MPGNNPQDTRLFRFAALTVLILIFITVATIKIWELRVTAERVGVLHTLGTLRSAIGIKLSEQVIHNGVVALETLHHSNPMRLWNPPPINYLGAFTTSTAPMDQGIWYFDSDMKLLIYRVRFSDYFISNNDQYPDLARYQLTLNYRDINNNQHYDSGVDQPSGLALHPIDSYSWSIETQ